VFKITRKVEYALIALKHIRTKAQGELSSAKEITERYATPFDMTAKVMQILAQKGVLKSIQGAHGGYVLTRDLSEISLFDFVEMMEGSIGIAKCLHNTETNCELMKTCNIASPLNYLNDKLIGFYKAMSLANILERTA